MDTQLSTLLALARRKHKIDLESGWAKGPERYLDALADEISEVKQAINHGQNSHTEDEMGDLLWNLANSLIWLEHTAGIEPQAVLNSAVRKYDERMEAIENGGSWKEVKERQRTRLEQA